MSIARTIAQASRAARREASPDPTSRRAPGPGTGGLLGNLREVQRDRLGFFARAAEEHGDVVRLRFGPVIAHLVRSPELVKHILQDNQANYSKQTRGFDELRRVLGNGLLTSEGSFWLRQRRIAQPAFHRGRIAGFADAMVRAADELCDAWQPAFERNEAVDVSAAMMRLTLRVVGETLLGTDVTRDADEVGPAVTQLLAQFNARISTIFQLPPSVPTRSNRLVRDSRRTLDRVVMQMIEQRRRDGNTGRNDLLAMLMEARDEDTHEGMNDEQLRDEVMTMFLAGHETTANALTWTFYLLAKSPPVIHTMSDELARVLPDGRAPTMTDLPSLEYLRRVVDESLRLYPPAWMIGRTCVNGDRLGGYDIPAGSLIFVSPYITHRDARLFPDPEGFDPDRFLPARFGEPHRFAYYPFGGGPRQCIGNTFALMEAQLILATIARRYRLELVPGQTVEPEAAVTLRPKHGIRMRLRATYGRTSAP